MYCEIETIRQLQVFQPLIGCSRLSQYVDADVTAETEYCYYVISDGNSESSVSTKLSRPFRTTNRTYPDLAGSSAGYDVDLTWTQRRHRGSRDGRKYWNPSSTRQGGDEISNATVITELVTVDRNNGWC